MNLHHGIVYTINHEGDLAVRHGSVAPLEDELIEYESAAPRLLRVAGLQAADFALFMADTEETDYATGYLISDVDPETGEGIIVSGNAIQQDPKTWLNQRLCGAIALVGAEEMASFGLSELHTHVTHLQRQS